MPLDASRLGPRTPNAGHRPERDLSRPLPQALSWTVLGVFAGALAVAVIWFGTPVWIPIAYGAMSVIAFAAYGMDKSAARSGRRRVSEQTLLTLGFACGWPGAVVAQQVFRHKTRKRSFRRAFWQLVVLNVVLLAIVLAATGMWGWEPTGIRDGFVNLFD